MDKIIALQQLVGKPAGTLPNVNLHATQVPGTATARPVLDRHMSIGMFTFEARHTL